MTPDPEHTAAAQQLRILHFAMGGSLLVLGSVTGILAVVRDAAPAGDGEAVPMEILSAAHAGVAVVLWALAAAVVPLLRRRPPPGRDEDERARNALIAVRVVTLMRLALIEAPAVLGLAVVLVGVVTGALSRQPLMACNGMSALVALAWIAMGLPTAEGIADQQRELLRS